MIDLGQIRDINTLRDIVVYTFAGETMKDANGNVVTADPIVSDAMKGKTVMCQYYGIRLILTAYSEAGNGYPGTCVFASLVHDETGNGTNEMHWLQYYSSDGVNFQWREGYYPLQKNLVSGTSIKTVNGNSLLGSGDLMLGRTVRLANATTSDGHIIVTETETYPARTFGDLFLVKFIDELPTTYSGTLYFNMMNAPVIYPNVTYHGVFLEYGTDVIQRGDTCLFLYNTGGIMWLLYNSRWGADIASKQDALPPVANNAGKVLAVNSAANGLEWVAQQGITQIKTVNGQSMEGTGDIVTTPAYTHYYYTVSDNTPLTITCPSGKRSHHTIVVQDYNDATGPTITINIQNLCDNEIVIMSPRRAIVAYPVSVKFNGVDAVVLSKSDNGWGIVDDSNSLLIYTKGLNVMLRMKAVPFNEFNAGHYVTVVGHLLETVYEPQQS